MSLKSINAKITAAGYPEVELERGRGYLYFIFDDKGPSYETESVMVAYLNIYSDAEWVEQGCDFGKRMRIKAADAAIDAADLGGRFVLRRSY